jgi:hypothetical protein
MARIKRASTMARPSMLGWSGRDDQTLEVVDRLPLADHPVQCRASRAHRLFRSPAAGHGRPGGLLPTAPAGETVEPGALRCDSDTAGIGRWLPTWLHGAVRVRKKGIKAAGAVESCRIIVALQYLTPRCGRNSDPLRGNGYFQRRPHRRLSVDHLSRFHECRRFEGDEFRIGHEFE